MRLHSLFARWGYRALPWPTREVQEPSAQGSNVLSVLGLFLEKGEDGG